MIGCSTCKYNKKILLSNGTEHIYCEIDNELGYWIWHKLEEKTPTEETKKIQEQIVMNCYESQKN